MEQLTQVPTLGWGVKNVAAAGSHTIVTVISEAAGSFHCPRALGASLSC